MFQCPICEQNTSIPVGGASVLPQNLHLGFEVEVAGYMSKMVSNSEVCCDECVDGRNGLAVVFCCMCRQFLCKHCRDHHSSSRKLSKHKIVGLDQEGARQLHTTMKPGDHYCSQPNHEDNKLNFYCETCSLLVCLHAVTHNGHTMTDISTLAKAQRMEMTGALEEAKEVVTQLTGAIDENKRMIEQVEISTRNAFLAVNQAFETLQLTLEERKKTLLSELEAISLSKTTALTLQKEQFEKMVGDIGHYTDMASQILQTHTDHEIVALGGLIPTELQATLKRVQTISLTPNQHSNISVSVKTDDLIRQLSKLGNIFDFYPSPSSCTWMSTSVARVGTRYHVKVQSKTSKGKEYPHGGVEVKGEMRSKTHNGAVVYGEVEDHRDGTYTITLTLQTAGPHQLLITMDGQHVQNSPNDLDVRPKRDYHTLCNAQQVIQCNEPRCVAIHDNGDIYVGSDDSCIYVFDQTGQRKNTIGSRGSGNGQFSYPSGISIKGDVLYVADSCNHRVQKLTSSGKFLHKFGQQGSGQGQFILPVAVIIDSNNKLIVSDYNNHRIQIFNEMVGNIHVATHGSNTIKVFSKEGVHVRMYGDPNGPRGLAIDGEGYSLVSECWGDCLSIYDPEGNKIHTVGNLKHPHGLPPGGQCCKKETGKTIATILQLMVYKPRNKDRIKVRNRQTRTGVWPLLSNLEDPDLGKIEAKPKVQKKSVIADMLKAMVEPMLMCRIGCLSGMAAGNQNLPKMACDGHVREGLNRFARKSQSPGDIVIPNWSQSRSAALDIKVTHTLKNSKISDACQTSGASAAVSEEVLWVVSKEAKCE
eukprot:Em0004g870a